MTSIPTIETERLILRGWREDDLDAYAAIMADPEVMRFLGGAMARRDSWRSMATMIGHWALRGFGLWAVERKRDGALIGRVGVQYPEGWPVHRSRLDSRPPLLGTGLRDRSREGLARFGFKTTRLPKLISLIDPENRLAERGQAPRLYQGGKATIFGKAYEWTSGRSPRPLVSG